jgi:hypothetical protein
VDTLVVKATSKRSIDGGRMPFKSEAQRRYFEANKSKLEKQGVDVEEWEQASKGMELPERAPKKAIKKKKAHT